MARFLVWSNEGNGLCLALRLHRDEHAVRFYIHQDQYDENGKGMVELTKSPLPHRGEVVLFDDVGFVRYGNQFRKAGHATIGGNPLEDWEIIRSTGTRIMEEHGILVPRTQTFKSLPAAKRFLEREGGFWYFKPDGKDSRDRTHHLVEYDFVLEPE